MNDPLKGVAHAETVFSIPKEVMDKAIELAELVDQQDEYGVTIVFNRGLPSNKPAPLLSGGLTLDRQIPYLFKVFDAFATIFSQSQPAEGKASETSPDQERRRLEQAEKVVH